MADERLVHLEREVKALRVKVGALMRVNSALLSLLRREIGFNQCDTLSDLISLAEKQAVEVFE